MEKNKPLDPATPVVSIQYKDEQEREFNGEYNERSECLFLDLTKVEEAFGIENLQFMDCERKIVRNGFLRTDVKYFVEGTPVPSLPVEGGFRTGISFNLDSSKNHVDEKSEIKETHERVQIIYEMVESNSFFNCSRIESRKASKEELKLCHDEKYIDDLENVRIQGSWGEFYVNEGTFEAASTSVGSLLNTIDEILSKSSIDNSFVITRPPGHHALKDSPKGFCFFSNVAIGAKYMLEKYPAKVRRVLIFDFDVHHGNGTQDGIVSCEDSILFISTHKNIYPNTGAIERSSRNTINVQFEEDEFSDASLFHSFHQIVMPVASEFSPDFILISAGFDALEFDPYNPSFGGKSSGVIQNDQLFGYFTHCLMSVMGGKNIALVLEGGYNLTRLPKCVQGCVKVLRGYPFTFPLLKNSIPKLRRREQRVIEKVKRVVNEKSNERWNCFRCMGGLEKEENCDSSSSSTEEEEGEVKGKTKGKKKMKRKDLVFEKVTILEDDDDGEESIFAPKIDVSKLKVFQYGGRNFIEFDEDDEETDADDGK